MAAMLLNYYVVVALFLAAFLKIVSMRRSLLCRPMGKWSRRCQWSLCSIGVLALVAYNAVISVGQQRAAPAPCGRRADATAPPPPSASSEWTRRDDACAPCTTPPPPEDDPIARLDLALGRWDPSRTFRMYDYAAVGGEYARLSGARRVCLATQSSLERLHELGRVAAGWSGPLSVAVFVAGDELRLLRAFVLHAMRCSPETYARLALHVLVTSERPPQAGPVPAAARRRVLDCALPPISMGDRREDTAKWRARNPYPQNHLRNLARRNCQSPYVFLVDVDIVPSGGMADALERFLATAPPCPLCAYVVPTYELDHHVATFPHNKTELIRLARKGLAIPFHRKVFIYNQYASNFSRWEASGGNESAATHVSHNVTNFELLYEPFYVAPDTVPAHDERFLGYGFTRNTQVYEMFLIGYQFQVLSPIFTIHWGLQQRRSRPLWREKQNERNRKHFETFKRELFARYRKDPLKLLHKPPPDKGKKT